MTSGESRSDFSSNSKKKQCPTLDKNDNFYNLLLISSNYNATIAKL